MVWTNFEIAESFTRLKMMWLIQTYGKKKTLEIRRVRPKAEFIIIIPSGQCA